MPKRENCCPSCGTKFKLKNILLEFSSCEACRARLHTRPKNRVLLMSLSIVWLGLIMSNFIENYAGFGVKIFIASIGVILAVVWHWFNSDTYVVNRAQEVALREQHKRLISKLLLFAILVPILFIAVLVALDWLSI